MRQKKTTILLYLGLLAIALSSVSAQDSQPVWRTSIEHSFSCIYTPLPQGADFVFLVGEPIDLKVSITNGTGRDLHLRVDDMKAPGRLVASNLAAADTARRFATEQAAIATMIVGSLRSELPVNWAGPITVQPGDRLEWSAKLVSAVDLVPPGKYEVSIVPDTAVGDASSWVVGRPLVLEIREPRGFAGSMELLRRQGMWHYVHDDYGAALASFDELLRRYPESHIAHVMKGNIALRQGDRDRARASYSAALALLERGADRLYLTERNPPLHIVEEARENVRGMLRGVQRSIR